MADNKWEVTTERFVLFFDILGFKDLVQRNTHEEVLGKLTGLTEKIRYIEKKNDTELAKRYKIDKEQIRSTTFSDSIIFFSQGETYSDLLAIVLAGGEFLRGAIEAGIPLKGAFSYGKITADFKQNIFFGQPIIDAYLLHEDLQMLWVVSDHHFEKKYYQLEAHKTELLGALCDYKVPLKTKKVLHQLLVPLGKFMNGYKTHLRKMYFNVSGNPRIYIDNTLEFLWTFKTEEPAQ